ncbi:MAG: adenosylmethionine--8-amino-7-oxononanoate transaminase [Candidatus Methylacidiphilales bacterium]|nr:adenosylmethionine--8-amino-7-oxononanoate transaminase [Candidatus Methylacidiphilales bacterium]
MNVPEIALDKAHVWHPFTPNDLWLDSTFEPIVIASGEGAKLTDTAGRCYLDGNSSIWTNLHGHRRPEINQAILDQLGRVAHSSFLGLTNLPAPQLAARLATLAGPPLTRAFFSDDGSTAMEAALKIAYQFFQQNGQPRRKTFLSLGSAYHGDTVGAMSLGHSPLFHHVYRDIVFETKPVMPPACYRCPFNRAAPEKTDARTTRQCQWECVGEAEKAFASTGETAAGWVLEPRVQGAAGFFMHPEGYLQKTTALARQHGALVILDEVMTGFGRTGPLFAYQKENIQPDLLALAKGLSGGYLPLAATLATETLFQGFGGGPERTFFHGHSYTGNALGCAAALASLDLLESTHHASHRDARARTLATLAKDFWALPQVGDVRQEGSILAVELVEDFHTRRPFDPAKRLGARVCQRALHHGLLTRPVGDVLLLMPPYCTTDAELEQMVHALILSIRETIQGPCA